MAERRGSVRIMTPVKKGVVRFEYTDLWSAGDVGSCSEEQAIFGLGRARCACAVRSFRIAKAAGIETHFLEQDSPTSFIAYELLVGAHIPSLSGMTHGVILPVEWLVRDVVGGSLTKRLRAGTIQPEELGFAHGTVVSDGMKLPKRIFEQTTKREARDRFIDPDEVFDLTDVDPDDPEIRNLLSRLSDAIVSAFAEVGIEDRDRKYELCRFSNGKYGAADVFGTPDEDRLIDSDTGEIFCKDLLRNHLDMLEQWKASLEQARLQWPNDKSKWPKYPPLPHWLIRDVSMRYQEAAWRFAPMEMAFAA